MLHRTRVFASLAIAALLLAAPASVSANGKHWKHHKHHHKHHGHHHGHGHYYAPRYVEHHYYGYPVYHHGYGGHAYCGPCGHYFDSYDDLSYHVHHHHHVAVLELPVVLFQASIGGGFGWVYEH